MHNDGRPVSPEKLQQTLDDVISQFGALSLYPQPIRGLWVHEGARYDDELIRIIVDVDDTPENQHFFLGLKSILLDRFEQIAVYIVSYSVDIL
jgi:hypothetical protein